MAASVSDDDDDVDADAEEDDEDEDVEVEDAKDEDDAAADDEMVVWSVASVAAATAVAALGGGSVWGSPFLPALGCTECDPLTVREEEVGFRRSHFRISADPGGTSSNTNQGLPPRDKGLRPVLVTGTTALEVGGTLGYTTVQRVPSIARQAAPGGAVQTTCPPPLSPMPLY